MLPNTTHTQPAGNTPIDLPAIILAGGLGTRLRSAVADLPKCLAPVAGKPFLAYAIGYLQRCGINNFILAAGYRHELLQEFIRKEYPELNIEIHIEKELMGTGGAIRGCCGLTEKQNVLVVNGDTLFEFDTDSLLQLHQSGNSDCTLCLKPMRNFDRYGTVTLQEDGRIIRFSEKGFCAEGLINAGVYCLNRESFLTNNFPEKFSFEQEYLSKLVQEQHFYGTVQDGYFIDIGIPEDYARAQEELKASHD